MPVVDVWAVREVSMSTMRGAAQFKEIVWIAWDIVFRRETPRVVRRSFCVL